MAYYLLSSKATLIVEILLLRNITCVSTSLLLQATAGYRGSRKPSRAHCAAAAAEGAVTRHHCSSSATELLAGSLPPLSVARQLLYCSTTLHAHLLSANCSLPLTPLLVASNQPSAVSISQWRTSRKSLCSRTVRSAQHGVLLKLFSLFGPFLQAKAGIFPTCDP